MNTKQLFSILALLTASGVAMAQAPAAEKPAAAASQNASAESKNKMPAMQEGKKAKSAAHEHKDDGPKKTIHSGA